MFSLVVKDILIIKKNILIGFAYMIFFLFAFRNMGNSAFLSGVVALTYLFIMSASAFEEKNNTDIILNSLPINRAGIVLSKYISVFVYLIISLIIFLIINYLTKILNMSVGIISISSMDILLAGFSVSLLNGIFLPIFFKFGYIKSRIFNLILLLAIFAGSSSIANLLGDNSNQYKNFISLKSELEISIYMVALILIITTISFLISLYIYRNKEF